MPERLEPVLTVIYLVFNEGYAATRGKTLVRADLCAEAIRLARLLRLLIKPQAPPEVNGLLALMLLHDARRDARTDTGGNIILLEDQDRSRWNRDQILEALRSLTRRCSAQPVHTHSRPQSLLRISEPSTRRTWIGSRLLGSTMP
jgi:RNA polymerase sigma-70 factor (ECF subfamily)